MQIARGLTQRRNPAKRSDHAWASNYLFTPTGALSLRCKAMHDGGHHRWADTQTTKVEQQLNAYVVALVEAAVNQRARKAYWAEQRHVDEAAALRRYEEAQRIRELEAETAAWQKSRQVRAYVAAVERAAKCTGPIEAGSELDEWLKWARAFAASLDPLRTDASIDGTLETDDEEL